MRKIGKVPKGPNDVQDSDVVILSGAEIKAAGGLEGVRARIQAEADAKYGPGVVEVKLDIAEQAQDVDTLIESARKTPGFTPTEN